MHNEQFHRTRRRLPVNYTLAHETQANPEVVLAQHEHIEVFEKRVWKAANALQVQARDLLSTSLMENGEVAA
ncbi:hypothetical protein DSCW_08930 [Desulfosarcina widdelii]|uniref:Uncharacterized protein n=1 Tax=Desulfosarcina widdelii TaxID=947919 RepID=A0A5K7YVX8_9BACT|nr:hypothetical protein DSCW_08930 [Desulfosarcina widdelii]